MPLKLSNNATGKLAASIDSLVTTIAIEVGDEINFPVIEDPGDWFPVVVVDSSANREIMRCTARTGTNMTVVRAQESTSAFSFSAGARVDVRLTAGALEEFMQKTAGNAMAGRLDLGGADDLGRVRFSGSQAPLATGKPLGFEFAQSDLFFGVKPLDVETVGKANRWVWNNQANGMGTDVMDLTDAGALSIIGAFKVGGTIVATGSITGGTTVIAKGATGNAHFWIHGPNGEDRMVLYAPVASAGSTVLRVTGTRAFTFDTAGQFHATGALFAGGAYLNTDGNITGSVWTNLGYWDAYTAIVNRIESRADAWGQAHANARFHAARSAGLVVVRMNIEGNNSMGAAIHNGGYYLCRFQKVGHNTVELESRQPQLYSNNTGWVMAFGF